MSRTPKKRGARLRVALAVGTAALAASAFAASTASAATVTLDHAFLKISGLEDPQEVITPANAIELKNVTFDGGGNFSVLANPDVNEIVTLDSQGVVTGGTFTITVDTGVGGAQTTTALAFNSTATQVKNALVALSNLGPFDPKVTGGPLPADIVIEFVGTTLYGINMAVNPSVDDALITGGGDVVAANTQNGLNTSDFDFPQFVGSASGVPLAVDLVPAGTVTGNYNNVTGVFSTASQNYAALISLGPPVNADCTLSPIPLDVSTEKTQVFLGDRFDAGALPLNGAVVDDWATLPSDAAPACGLINGLTAGPGGLWMSNGIATPSFPAVPATPTPPVTPKKKCKKGQKLKKVKGKFKCVKKKKKKK